VAQAGRCILAPGACAGEFPIFYWKRCGRLALLAVLLIASAAQAVDFVEFETGPVRALATNGAGNELYAVNTPDNRLEIFDVTDNGLVKTASVPVGMEPCAVAVAPDGKVWVVNHLSDSVSIVDATLSPPQVVNTLVVGDEPRDIVFAGTAGRAFVTTAHRGQHRIDPSITAVPGAGDPQMSTEGIGRADVWVFDPSNLGVTSGLGGVPVEILVLFTDTPRSMAVSNDGNTLYVAAFRSGNRTTAIPELMVCDGFDPTSSCDANDLDPSIPPGLVIFPGGLPGPSTNAGPAFDPAPETGMIVKFDGASWIGPGGNDWTAFINFSLQDSDVFAINANTLNAGAALKFGQVGTVLFNMAVHPTNDKIYVSNTELPNHVLFEGPGHFFDSTVQGHLSESRISLLSGTNTVDVRQLNKHIDYTKLHTDVPDVVDPTQKNHSLATPLDMVFDSTGTTLYVAAYGSAKIGVFPVASLEADSFDPTVESANYIPTGGGPNGLILDEARNRMYLQTRFDNALNVIDLATTNTLQVVPLHNPEPQSVVDGRPMLYDAFNFSGNGEASCASCHIFGDVDDLAWNLGNPDDPVTNNPQPAPVGGGTTTFHPMKGPMTTQTLRGLGTHGAMHWRGDRADGIVSDPCTEPTGAACSENTSFMNFRVAFEGLIGMDGVPTPTEMQAFTDFIMKVVPPPNPVRNLNNTLTSFQLAGLGLYFAPDSDGGASCNDCHILDPLAGFFGTGGGQSFEGQPQNMKIPHLRNAYTKIGMFGMFVEPDLTIGPITGPQVRGFGFLHDGIVDTIRNFLGAVVFTTTPTEEAQLEQFVLAFPSDLAPAVGQQVTLDSTNIGVAGGRIANFRTRAAASFESLVLGGAVTQCDLVVRGQVAGAQRGWLYNPITNDYTDDLGNTIVEATLTAFATSDGPLTFTCAPPGSGVRMAHNRDRDTLNDGADNCPDASNDLQTDTDGDLLGDACDQDDDGDTLLDYYETNSGTFNGAFDTGTDPLLVDTDGDGIDDGVEVAQNTDPTDPNDPLPPLTPALPLGGAILLACVLLGAGVRAGRRG